MAKVTVLGYEAEIPPTEKFGEAAGRPYVVLADFFSEYLDECPALFSAMAAAEWYCLISVGDADARNKALSQHRNWLVIYEKICKKGQGSET
jgi:hypothetical protein